MNDGSRPKSPSESERVAFYGALYAMAAADGHMDRREIELVLDVVGLRPLAEQAEATVRGYLIEPPSLDACLARLSDGDRGFRLGVMLGLLQVALADAIMESAELDLLVRAERTLGISPRERTALEGFAAAVRFVERRGHDDEHARRTLERVTGDLTDVGIPASVVYLSGAIVRLRAAGITSALSAIGLGLGTAPGLDAALVLGIELSAILKRALDPARAQSQGEGVIRNLEATIGELIERVVELGEAGDENSAALQVLNRRLRVLQQIAHARRQQLAAKSAAQG